MRTMSVPSSKSTIVSPTTPSAGLKTKTSAPAPPSNRLLPSSPVSVSAWPEPVRSSIPVRTSPWAWPPRPVPSARFTVTSASEPA